LHNLAVGERERAPVNQLCGSFRPKELYVGYETSTFKKVTAFYETNLLMPVRPRRRFVSLSTPPEQVVELLERERPDVLVGYGGWLDLFFRTAAARGLSFPPPKVVLYMGEALPTGGRELIEGQFGIPLLSRYNAVESFKIGFTCAERRGFHLHEDLCHLRIVRRDGTPAAVGEKGSVLLTNLVGRATVLINYPIGDIAALSPETCACGRTFALLSELDGRLEDVITLEDGSFVHPRSVWQVFKDDAHVLQYRLIQRGPRDFEVQLATLDDPAFERAIARARPTLTILLGADAAITCQRLPALDLRQGGKFRAVLVERGPGAG
jgi:phenylacetate-CoA ligase